MMMVSLCCCVALVGAAQNSCPMWTVDKLTQPELPAKLVPIGTDLQLYDRLRLANGNPTPPYLQITSAVRLNDGTVWAGTPGGLMRRIPGKAHWRLFHSRRWLPDNTIQKLVVVGFDDVWVKTPKGTAHIYRANRTLPEKMATINRQLLEKHVRFGLVGSVNLQQPGNFDGGVFQPDSDNDGLWTALYVAAESFRFATTGDTQARENAWKSLQALMFLEKITGCPGFVARSVVPIRISKKGQFPWQRSKDGKWWWKGDTSSDELDGHFFAYSVYYDLAATDVQKKAIRAVVQRIMDHLIQGGLYYRDPSGRITTWGCWAPESLNRDPEWIAERGLNSMEILSYLKTTYHITEEQRFHQKAQELINKHGYAMNTIRLKLTQDVDVEVNHSDDELAFIAYYPLLRYERDPVLRKIYLMSLQRSWLVERPERSPLFNYIYAAGVQASSWPHPDERPPRVFLQPSEYDRKINIRWFCDVPSDLIEWTVINRNRSDLGKAVLGRHGQLCNTRVLPVSERRVMRWNGDPYELDGGSGGRTRDDGTFILLPYWMGRYHRFVD